jgi:polo-like kinase 1
MNEDIIEEENEKREVVNQYQKGQTLGSGGFAKCYEVLHLGSSKKYAIKIVSKEEISDEKSKQKLLL